MNLRIDLLDVAQDHTIDGWLSLQVPYFALSWVMTPAVSLLASDNTNVKAKIT